jgi:uncharacterized protein (TIRG00374 family)
MNMRRVLTLLGLFGLAYLAIANLGQADKLAAALRGIHWYVVPLLIIMQVFSYWANAGFYRAFFRMTDRHVGLYQLSEISLAVNFANTVIPAGGVAGATFLAQAVHSEVPHGQATLSQIGRYIFTFLSYFVILGLGFILLFFGGNIGQISVRFIILIMLVLLVGALVLIMIFAERQRLEAVVLPIVRGVNFGWRKILRQSVPLIEPDRVRVFLDDFYEAYMELSRHRRYRLQLFGWGLTGNVFEVLSVYVVFVGFGHWVNPGVVIAAYTFAIISSIAGFLTNGIGVYEAGMIGTLTALGQPFSLAFAVVLLYRALSLILFLPPGFYYYRKYLRARERSASSESDSSSAVN